MATLIDTVSGWPLARQAATADVVDALRAGKVVSKRVVLQGSAVFVEARPTRTGGVVLVQRRADAQNLLDQIVPQWLWLVAGIGVLWCEQLGQLRVAAVRQAQQERLADVEQPEGGAGTGEGARTEGAGGRKGGDRARAWAHAPFDVSDNIC